MSARRAPAPWELAKQEADRANGGSRTITFSAWQRMTIADALYGEVARLNAEAMTEQGHPMMRKPRRRNIERQAEQIRGLAALFE